MVTSAQEDHGGQQCLTTVSSGGSAEVSDTLLRGPCSHQSKLSTLSENNQVRRETRAPFEYTKPNMLTKRAKRHLCDGT